MNISDLLGLPALATEHGAEVDRLMLYVHWLMAALFIGWLAYFLYVIFRFHQSRQPKANYVGVRSHASSYVEGAVVVVEGILLLGLSVPIWSSVVDRFPPESESTVVRVIGQQFFWSFRYPGPDGVFGRQDPRLISSTNIWGVDPADPNGEDDFSPMALNELVVPVNKPVILHISSPDVVHSFKVHSFRVTQDAIPGITVPTWFKPTKEGQYMIKCAQLCGNGHAAMRGFLHVVSEERYQEWLEETMAAATPASRFE
jgi:cytochrome c oxidase subunit II